MDIKQLAELVKDHPRGAMGLNNLIYHDVEADELWANNFMGFMAVYVDGAVASNAQEISSAEQFAVVARSRAELLGDDPTDERLVWWNAHPRKAVVPEGAKAYSSDLFVEIERVGPQVFVRRGWNNGYMHEQHEELESAAAAASMVEQLAARYDQRLTRARGPVSWQEEDDGPVTSVPVIREYRGTAEKGFSYASCAVSGSKLMSRSPVDGEQSGEVEHGSEDQAQAAMEAWIRRHLRAGFLPKVLELTPSIYAG